MAKKKCKGGVCALNNMPKSTTSRPAISSATNALPAQPIYPANTPYQAVKGIGQGVPQQYNPVASLQQQMAPLQGQQQNMVNPIAQQLQQLPQQQYNQQGQLQGPLQGLAQGGWYNPYAQQQVANPALPIPTAQNVAIPQGQVFHPNQKQRGAVGRFFKGTKPQVYNNPLYTDYQNDVLNYITQMGLSGIEDLQNNQFDFAPIGNQELERFYTQTIPSLAERFTALGGGQRSSAFQGALGQAGRFLGNDLAAQQQQYGLQQQGMNQNLYSNLLNMGLRPQFESNLQPGKGGALGGVVQGGVNLLRSFI